MAKCAAVSYNKINFKEKQYEIYTEIFRRPFGSADGFDTVIHYRYGSQFRG